MSDFDDLTVDTENHLRWREISYKVTVMCMWISAPKKKISRKLVEKAIFE